MRKLKLNKKGVLGMNTAAAFVVGLLSLAIVGIAVLITLNALNATSVATTETTSIVQNVSVGLTSLFTQAGTWFTLLSVVIIILIIAVVIFVVRRFGDTGTGGGTL